jgi:hypothetical protein
VSDCLFWPLLAHADTHSSHLNIYLLSTVEPSQLTFLQPCRTLADNDPAVALDRKGQFWRWLTPILWWYHLFFFPTSPYPQPLLDQRLLLSQWNAGIKVDVAPSAPHNTPILFPSSSLLLSPPAKLLGDRLRPPAAATHYPNPASCRLPSSVRRQPQLNFSLH